MEDIPSEFIQPSEHRPSLSLSILEDEGIPVIDISAALSNKLPNSNDKLIRDVREACEKWGFFQVINHGIPQEKRDRVELVAREFYALSSEEKKKVSRDVRNPLGYYDAEHTKNVRDWKEIYDFTFKEPTLVPASPEVDDNEITELINQWPAYPPDFRVACEEYTQETLKLALKLLELIALSLGLAADSLNGYFKEHTSFSRLNHYLPCPAPHLTLGAGRHKDTSALTVLSQDHVGGLEIKRKTDGEWILVKPISNAYIINLGDVMQVWSNDKYESVEHRVKVKHKQDRFSVPFFLCPSHYVMVKPLDELINEQNNPAKYMGYNYGKFYSVKRLSDYKKLPVENVQMDNFRLTK